MTDKYEIDSLLNATAFDSEGNKLGSVSDIFLNDESGQPDFVKVNHGLFGMKSSIVPMRGHTLRGEELHLAFEKDRIKDAPDLGDDGHLSATDRDSCFRHYHVNDLESVTQYRTDRPSQSRTGVKRGVNGTILDDSHVDADRERVVAGEGEAAGDQDRPTDLTPGFDDYAGQDQFAGINKKEHEEAQERGEDGTNLDTQNVDADRERIEAENTEGTAEKADEKGYRA